MMCSDSVLSPSDGLKHTNTQTRWRNYVRESPLLAIKAETCDPCESLLCLVQTRMNGALESMLHELRRGNIRPKSHCRALDVHRAAVWDCHNTQQKCPNVLPTPCTLLATKSKKKY